jgi:hypothetical protein
MALEPARTHCGLAIKLLQSLKKGPCRQFQPAQFCAGFPVSVFPESVDCPLRFTLPCMKKRAVFESKSIADRESLT